MKKAQYLFLTLLVASLTGFAQKEYNFSVDLTKPLDDKLTVELETPSVRGKSILYHLPKIVPGTYSINNYGSYATNFKAFDKKGRELKVEKIDKNSWKISKPRKLSRLSYQIDDTWDTPEIEEDVFEPSGTNIDEDKVFVLNTFGLFGYFQGMDRLPYRVNITKPAGFYGSTPLINQNKGGNQDLFVTKDYHELADSPMMYNRPDTVWLKVGNADILVSVFSPNDKFATKDLAADIKPTLEAQKDYMGGTLPIDKYAFIIYMSDDKNLTRYGALEHSQSSFYYLPETFSEAQLSKSIKDIAAHEFFHILTPLNIHSEEIGDFDFIDPKMSRHLWLYEGLTEYAAHHAQLRAGIIDLTTYLDRQADKVENSRTRYTDTLSFTAMSSDVLEKYKDEYSNVYEKGALIGLSLDLKLRQLSGGKYGTQDLLRDLAKTYGKDKSFKDEELFDKITELTFPEMRDFFRRYVEGGEPLPLKELFSAIGIDYDPEGQKKEVEKAFGVSFALVPGTRSILISSTDQATDLGQRLGVEQMDQIVLLNDQPFDADTYSTVLQDYDENFKLGDEVSFTVKRKMPDNSINEVKLTADLREATVTYPTFMPKGAPTPQQLQLRESWMGRMPQ
ncbi:M61 family metallopeptidase [Persicitalea jodogahamensis]|uniref:Peptidase M61 n=1 Tax=Persicitalea jodogahamensis TaxID=402147 RepID=A0A8J3D946_9BACT|nr:peptidase M61 [Persicitalea jodogahamensis]GHB70672.1 peptidase M61 [Persicitalea jodogahamensis]